VNDKSGTTLAFSIGNRRIRMATDRDDHDALENPLGIAREPIAHDPADEFPRSEPSARRRRARALGEDGIERPADPLGDLNTDPVGATGIDMGSGGQGHGVEPGDR
jgi:hypothetical protein